MSMFSQNGVSQLSKITNQVISGRCIIHHVHNLSLSHVNIGHDVASLSECVSERMSGYMSEYACVRVFSKSTFLA